MTRSTRLIPAALAALVLSLLLAPAAGAGDFQRIFADYRDDGVITPCKYSDADLKQAQRQVPNDIEQYAPDFPAALADALQASARGDCDRSKKKKSAVAPSPATAPSQPPAAPAAPAPAAAAGAPAPTPAAAPPPAPPALPAQGAPAARAGADQQVARAAARRTSDASAPAPLIVLAALAGLLLLAGAFEGLARLLGWELRPLAPARHAFAEAGYRTGSVWAEFVDWVRLGR